jgi:hypothetical protein
MTQQSRWDVNVSVSNAFTDEVEVNHNMLSALMLDRVGGMVDHTDVVAVG